MKNTIKIDRAINNLTQEQLANLVNVSRQTINAIELKKFIPSTVLALKIAKVFNKPVEEIFQLEEGEKINEL
jgi:putative transcriptional regulator